jgi:hypothetical protein
MTSLDPRTDGWIDALVERTTAQLRTELHALAAQLSEIVVRQRAEAEHEASTSAESAANALLTEAIALERSNAQALAAEAEGKASALQATIERLSAEIADLRDRTAAYTAEVERQQTAALLDARAAERQAGSDAVGTLGEGCRELDTAQTLSSLLNALADCAARLVDRSALLVLRGGTLRGWSARGLDREPATIEVNSADRTPVARAWQTGKVEASTADDLGAHLLSPTQAGHIAIAIPIVVDRDVVAVLYGGDEGGGRQAPTAWAEGLEVLARYAGRCLESLTRRRMPELMRASAAERAKVQMAQQDDESAQRYARLLVAEIKLYNEAALEEGRRESDIMRRLRPQIERAQALYNERVPAEHRARTAYFEDELVRTLAGGDRALLGQAT